MTTTEITLRQIESPSRSKMAGPCWIAIGDNYASEKPKTISAEVGDEIEVKGKAMLRKSRGGTWPTERKSWLVVVTGDESDVVTLRVGSSQSVVAEIRGVREVEEEE